MWLMCKREEGAWDSSVVRAGARGVESEWRRCVLPTGAREEWSGDSRCPWAEEGCRAMGSTSSEADAGGCWSVEAMG